MNTHSKSFADFFWANVEKTETCWLWKGKPDIYGYGRIQLMRKTFKAHRIAYELTYNPPPPELAVCHHCDVRNCVRPDHLFLGTTADNQKDMEQKGRSLFGEKNGRAKVTQEQVEEIRRLYAQGGITQARIGYLFGITQNMVSKIILKQNWKSH